jgi:hypothetical protein
MSFKKVAKFTKIVQSGHSGTVGIIDIESLQNRLLKVCYVPATSTGLNRLLFFFAAAVNSTKANKAGSSSCKSVYIT